MNEEQKTLPPCPVCGDGNAFHPINEQYVYCREQAECGFKSLPKVWAFLSEKCERADELQSSFDLRWKADMRAIKMWQEKTGRTEVWPDHADLCVWLLEGLDELKDLMMEAYKMRALADRCNNEEPEELAAYQAASDEATTALFGKAGEIWSAEMELRRQQCRDGNSITIDELIAKLKAEAQPSE